MTLHGEQIRKRHVASWVKDEVAAGRKFVPGHKLTRVRKVKGPILDDYIWVCECGREAPGGAISASAAAGRHAGHALRKGRAKDVVS